MFEPLENKKGGNYLSIKSGESIVGFFKGTPKKFYEHYKLGICTKYEPEGCRHCDNGAKAAFRFDVDFVTEVDGVIMTKIFKQGKKVYNILAGLSQDYDLSNWLVRITRQGSTKEDTVYTVNPLPKGELTKEMLEYKTMSEALDKEEDDIPY